MGGDPTHEVLEGGPDRRVPISVHWTVVVLAGASLVSAVGDPLTAVTAAASYLGMLLVHELGHARFARLAGCPVYSVQLYPLHGRCEFGVPGSGRDEARIVWGGVLAQFAIALPVAAYVGTFGYTGFRPLDAPLAIFGFISPVIALLNLMPIAPLDGYRAWRLLPYLYAKRHQARPARAGSGRISARFRR